MWVMLRPSTMILGPTDGPQQRRLAGPVGAQQRHDLALLDVEVDIEEDLVTTVEDTDAAADQELGGALRLQALGLLGGG